MSEKNGARHCDVCDKDIADVTNGAMPTQGSCGRAWRHKATGAIALGAAAAFLTNCSSAGLESPALQQIGPTPSVTSSPPTTLPDAGPLQPEDFAQSLGLFGIIDDLPKK